MFIILVIIFGWWAELLDVKGCFLQGSFEEGRDLRGCQESTSMLGLEKDASVGDGYSERSQVATGWRRDGRETPTGEGRGWRQG